MSPVAIGLDLVLVALLLAALVVGLRLNRRLKTLRDGQEGFVRAVGELDAAAARAEAGLKALRAASEDAHDTLLTRIETARGLIARLETASEAGRFAQLKVIPAPSASPAALADPRPEPRPEPRPRLDLGVVRAPRRAPVRGLDEDLFEDDPRARSAAGREGLVR